MDLRRERRPSSKVQAQGNLGLVCSSYRLSPFVVDEEDARKTAIQMKAGAKAARKASKQRKQERENIGTFLRSSHCRLLTCPT